MELRESEKAANCPISIIASSTFSDQISIRRNDRLRTIWEIKHLRSFWLLIEMLKYSFSSSSKFDVIAMRVDVKNNAYHKSTTKKNVYILADSKIWRDVEDFFSFKRLSICFSDSAARDILISLFVKTRDFFSLMRSEGCYPSTAPLNFIMRYIVRMYICDKSTIKEKHVFWIALISSNALSFIFIRSINFDAFARSITSPSLSVMRYIVNICICRELTTWKNHVSDISLVLPKTLSSILVIISNSFPFATIMSSILNFIMRIVIKIDICYEWTIWRRYSSFIIVIIALILTFLARVLNSFSTFVMRVKIYTCRRSTATIQTYF